MDFPPFLLATSSFSNLISKCQQNHWHLKRPKKWPLHCWDIVPGLILQEAQIRAMAAGLASFYAWSIILSSFIHSVRNRALGTEVIAVNRSTDYARSLLEELTFWWEHTGALWIYYKISEGGKSFATGAFSLSHFNNSFLLCCFLQSAHRHNFLHTWIPYLVLGGSPQSTCLLHVGPNPSHSK